MSDLPSFKSRSSRVLSVARELAHEVRSWSDFSDRVLDAVTGVVAREFPDEADRRRFYLTEDGDEVHKIFLGVMSRTGVIDGADRS